ncbi:hypothetical protein SDC9_104618 [bioreactor metagenome]|uniref:Uncharacterized protein n=1 Tax=bioreactor metagenome TaxID=1076179 RepID=A0A645AX25_9ZZZZ
MVPVQQHRPQAGHQPVGDVARAGQVVVVFFGQRAAQHRHAGAHHVHGVAGGGQLFQCFLHARGQAAQGAQLVLVGAQFGAGGQLAVHQQVGDFLVLADLGHVGDVVATVVQIIARLADRAQRGVARRDAGKGDRFLGLERRVGGNGCDGVHARSPGRWAACEGLAAGCWTSLHRLAILRNLRNLRMGLQS